MIAKTGGAAGRMRRAAAFAIVAAFVAACSSDGATSLPTTTAAAPPSSTPSSTPSTTPTTPSTSSGDGVADGVAGQLFAVRLSEGHVQSVPEPLPVVNGTPIDDATIAEIVGRLPEWATDDSLTRPFAWPTQTLPPPRTGDNVDMPFPPAEGPPPPEVPAGPLEVVRFQPEGVVAIAPFVSVTFNQPMVPVGTLAQLDQADVPVTITPAITGRWQWIGTRTLRFDHDSALFDRLPMATTYTVEIPAGTRSVTGAELAQTVSWAFTTPPLTVQSLQPINDSLALVPLFVATFDQRVDAAAVLDTVVVRAGDDAVAVRLATAEEITADDVARQTTASAPEARWLAFRPVDPLPADTRISVEIGPGTPSAEGPLTTADAATFTGRTYAQLRVLRVECGYAPDCPPGADINIVFNNVLDPERFDPSWVRIVPALAGATVSNYGDVINIRGATQARTTYEVTVSKDLVDIHGQALGDDTTATVTFGTAPKMLAPFERPLTTLDPLASAPGLSVLTVNHDDVHVRVFDVEPADWPDYQLWLFDGIETGTPAAEEPAAWAKVLDTTVDVDGDDDHLAETVIDLTELLDSDDGHLVVLVEPTEPYSPNSDEFWSNRPTATWVQATTVGLDAFADADELLIWATDLRDGAPLAGVMIEALDGGRSATTDADGLATLALSKVNVPAVVATSGDDVALLPGGYYGDAWIGWDQSDEARWYVIDDRQVYRPGETVSMKGWVRRLTVSGDAQLALLGGGAEITYTAYDPQGNTLGTGTAELNALGGFDLTFDIAEEANLGYSYVELQLVGAAGLSNPWYSHAFQIQEFRRPEFEVVARPESVGPFVSSRPATVAVDADYYAGGPLPSAAVDWQVTTSRATYAPPGWDEFAFGVWTPWWIDDFFGYERGFAVDVACCFPPDEIEVERFSGTTGADGTHYLQIDFAGADGELPDLPVTVTAQATVNDVNRQAWASSTNLLVHPGELYIGMRSPSTFVREGDPLDIEAVVTDIDGNAVPGREVVLTASRLEWTTVNGEWTETSVDAQVCTVTSAEGPVDCTFTTTVGGTYEIVSVVVDDQGARSRTELTRWVSGGDSPPSRGVDQQSITVVPDRAEYQPGDTAQVLIQAPFTPAEGLLTTLRNGIVSTIRFQIVDGSAVVEVPIGERDIPQLDLTIEVVGATTRTADDGAPLADAPLRPAYATGGLTLSIPPVSRELSISAEPRDTAVEPGATTQVDVRVTSASGQPVAGAEFAVVVVDEAVLALSGYQLGDPLDAFYGPLWSQISARYGRETIVLADPESVRPDGVGEAATDTASPSAGGEEAPAATVPAGNQERSSSARDDDSAVAYDSGVPITPIAVRTDFDALAVFAPEVVTDADGRAVVEVPLPDNLTRYRVMVVAVDGAERFGSTEANITARLPLMVRPSAPRFLNFGDSFELPVVLQNQTDAPMEVDVTLQTSNLTVLGAGADASSDAAGRRVSVPANDRVEVRFPVAAAAVGTARFRVAAVSGDAADAATVELPVYTPATAEAFATYGVIDDGSTIQPLLAPTDVVPQFGGLEVTTSSTSLQALTDAVLYLTQYPYDSSDGMASRILAIAALRDVLDQFDAAGLPRPEEIEAAVRDDIEGLVALQNDDGGFPFWERFRGSEPFNTIEVAHALVEAQAEGYAVPQDTLDRALGYLVDIEDHFPSEYGQEIRDTLSAYALHVRTLAGDRDVDKAEALFDRRGEDLPLDAVAWLWPSIDDPAADDQIERLFENRAVETAGAANFSTDYGDDAYVILHSDRRTDGIVLDALIAQRPESDLIPKVVAGLLGNQQQGRWDNVQENAFILLALKRYFDTYENQTPDFVARVWLGDRFAGEHEFAGRSTDRVRMSIPTAELIETGDTDIVIGKEGAGRLYYRLGLRYAPADLHLDPLDRGFVVERSYEAVDDPADVSRDADGTWRIRPGALVRVRLTMVAESQRTHVALIDPLPAGLEILNTGLAVTPDVAEDPEASESGGDFWPYWWFTWYDHENARDDRAEAFASLLPGGTYEYTYLARATTPGTWVVPPTRAEEMYAPETFGRAATDTVVIAAP